MQCSTALMPSFRNRGIELQSLTKTFQSLGGPVQRPKRNSVIMKRHLGRPMVLQGATEIGLSLGKTAELHQHHPHQVGSPEVLWLGAQDSVEQTHGIGKLAGLQCRQRALKVTIDNGVP